MYATPRSERKRARIDDIDSVSYRDPRENGTLSIKIFLLPTMHDTDNGSFFFSRYPNHPVGGGAKQRDRETPSLRIRENSTVCLKYVFQHYERSCSTWSFTLRELT